MTAAAISSGFPSRPFGWRAALCAMRADSHPARPLSACECSRDKQRHPISELLRHFVPRLHHFRSSRKPLYLPLRCCPHVVVYPRLRYTESIEMLYCSATLWLLPDCVVHYQEEAAN